MEGEDLEQGLIVVQGQDQQILLQDENSHFAVGDGGHLGVASGAGENEQVFLNTEGGEVFVFDEESGQYQRYFYVQNDENGFDPNAEEEDTSTELGMHEIRGPIFYLIEGRFSVSLNRGFTFSRCLHGSFLEGSAPLGLW